MKFKIKGITIVLAITAIFYASISLVPHYNFGTNAFDLGIFNQTIYQYAHFEPGPNTVREVPTLLADHLELLLFIFSPLYFIFGSYTLLIVQILMLLFGAYGIYLLIKLKTKDEFLSITGTCIFASFFGLVTAMAFDYHNNVVGTMFIPWLFYALEKRKFKWYYLLLFLFLVSKENMALMSVFLGISILIFNKEGGKKHGIITIVVSGLYFVSSLKMISYFNNGPYDHWPYTALGSSPGEALLSIFLHPIATLGLLFDNEVKIKMWILLVLSGGILAISKPKYSILLIPLIAQKFFSDQESFWGFSHHYAVEFAPIIAVASMMAIYSFMPRNSKKALAIVVLLLNLGILSQIHFYNGENISRIFEIEYYIGPPEKASIVEALNLTKTATYVSAQNTFVPHLEDKKIILFPKIEDAELVVLNVNEKNTWPLKNTFEVQESLESIQQSGKYWQLYNQNGVYVFGLK